MSALFRDVSCRLHARIRRGIALGLPHRLWGTLSVALQKAVSTAILLDDKNVEKMGAVREPIPGLADLPVAVCLPLLQRDNSYLAAGSSGERQFSRFHDVFIRPYFSTEKK